MRRGGFTLLELTLVLAVIVLLAAMAYPSLEAMYAEVRLTAAADQVRAAWADARAKAVEDGLPYRFAVMPADGRYRIAPDSGDYWAGGAGAAAPADADSPPLDREDALPKGVSFADDGLVGEGDEAAGWVTLVRFQPDGTASRDVEVVFTAAGCRPLQVRLRGLTGAVTTQHLPLGGRSP
jgi:prepilin-type N-terminal cleavage/methylation domain-containing protein